MTSDKQSLTGMWHGVYSYAHRDDPSPFVAILVHSGSTLSGTTHETSAMDPLRGQTLYATLDGTCDGASVAFPRASPWLPARPNAGWP